MFGPLISGDDMRRNLSFVCYTSSVPVAYFLGIFCTMYQYVFQPNSS